MNKPLSRIRNLQALRLYAAIPVILYHTGFRLPGLRPVGVFGVHLFFLLSGYIMASIIDTDTTAFLRRRLIRILPLYWFLTLLLYSVAWKFPHLMNATRAYPSELIKSLFFVPFAKSNGKYQPILFVGWTINYEMFFYMMLSAAVIINRKRAVLLGTVMILAVMGVSSLFAQQSSIARFYSDPVLLECLFGLLSYYAVRYTATRLTAAAKPALFGITIAAMLLLPSIEEWHLLGSLPMVLQFGPLCFLLICSVCLLAWGGSDIKATTIVLLGDASYVMYLVHPYIEEFLDRVIGRFLPIFHITTPVGCLIAMAFVLPISVFLYLKVDKPIVRYLNQTLCGRRRSDPSIVAAPVAAVAVVEAGTKVIAHTAPAMTNSTLAYEPQGTLSA
jgi:peptidoglycan/LPS O-acetylase OafA/YrhL